MLAQEGNYSMASPNPNDRLLLTRHSDSEEYSEEFYEAQAAYEAVLRLAPK
jgi:hypothetical protein